MSVIKPTVGRIVWYWPGATDPGIDNGDQPLAAIVTHVWSDSCINLSAFGQDGTPHGRKSVTLIQEGEGRDPDNSFAEWMPYQKGQAAKHDAEQKGDAK